MKTLRCLLVLILLATLSLPAMAAGDAIVARDRDFFERMARQSLIVADILERAHRPAG